MNLYNPYVEVNNMTEPENWSVFPSMFGHFCLKRKGEDTEMHVGILFRRHEVPDIIERLKQFYDNRLP
jgi:hypothetical protein